MSDPLARLGADDRSLARRGDPPRGSDAMKAVLTDERPSGRDWIFERKLDGIRCVARCLDGGVELLSRNDLDLNGRFPEIVHDLSASGGDLVLDGEVVAFEGRQTSFARLAARGHRPVAVYYYVFDILWVHGWDVRPLPLDARKRLLRDAVDGGNRVRLTAHRTGDGEALLREACRKRWEGLIAKRRASPYVHARSKSWLKLKCAYGQELVIGGFTAPRGSRHEFGALLVGYYEGGRLRYAGKVGTGFDRETLRDLGERMRSLATDASPFADEIRERGVTWVRPELVGEVGFSEWTEDGRLRHPRFLGLRDDKLAPDVVREAP
jgi:bifunctional non-homologous end joining protein LigD